MAEEAAVSLRRGERKVLDRNPEGAAPRGKWADVDFLRDVCDLNPQLKDTQFADYHGHGWNFRAVFKRDREGNLLDADGNIVANDDPREIPRRRSHRRTSIALSMSGHAVRRLPLRAGQPWQRPYLWRGGQRAIEIGCKDCHGTVSAYPILTTSGPAAPPGGTDLAHLRNPDGRARFEWRGTADALSALDRSIPSSNGK